MKSLNDCDTFRPGRSFLLLGPDDERLAELVYLVASPDGLVFQVAFSKVRARFDRGERITLPLEGVSDRIIPLPLVLPEINLAGYQQFNKA